MKRTIVIIILLLCISTVVKADEIVFMNGEIINCKVVAVFKDSIEYTAGETVKSKSVNREKVHKIVYMDGRQVIINRKDAKKLAKDIDPKHGVLYLADGRKIIAEEIIEQEFLFKYREKGERVFNIVSKKFILEIKYGTEGIQFRDNLVKEKEYYKKSNEKIHTDGFHQFKIWFSFILGLSSLSSNGIENDENKIFDEQKSNVPDQDTTSWHSDDLQYYSEHYGIDLDIIPFVITYPQKRAFNLTGISFGIKGRLIKQKLEQQLYDDTDDGDNKEISRERLMETKSWQAGPSLNLIFSPRDNLFNMVIHSFIIGGQIFDGKYQAAPVLRNEGISLEKTQYYTKVSGYIYTFGSGLFFTLNKWFPATIGFTIFSSYSKIKFDNELPIYISNKTDYSFRLSGIEFSIGFHL